VAATGPAEVAGLGRAETPQEKADRIQKARAERKARQNMRNLVWSLLTSLGVVALLVFVVARPDTNLVTPIDWRTVASEASAQAPGELVVPDLSDEWSANRAEISGEAGVSALWSIGLLGPNQSFVFIDQGFDADARWVSLRTRQALQTGTIDVGLGGDTLSWREFDRTDVDPGGNYAYVLVRETPEATIVVGGNNAESVRLVAEAVTAHLVKE
jgi:hypothetical protein